MSTSDPKRTTDLPVGKPVQDPAATTDRSGQGASADPNTGVSQRTGSYGSVAAADRPRSDAVVPAIPDYEIEGELGRGGMGVVYRARQTALNRPVAIKMILGGKYTDPLAQARFLIEAEVIASIQHPHVVQLFQFGRHDDQPFFVLEFVGGGSLEGKLKTSGRFTPRDAAAMVAKLAEGMAAAHQKGVVHRDLKPANVLLTEAGEPKITDFGLAKTEQSDVTATGAVMGTPSYMSPEQAEGKTREVGTPTDVYALGAILYQLTTDRPPFKGNTVMATIQQVITQEPVRPRAVDARIPRDLETICLKCLAKDQKKRYATAAELAAELHAFLEGRPITARPVGLLERSWKWAKRNPAWTAGIAAGLLLLAVATVTGFAIRNATHAAGLVQAILNANTTEAPAIIENMAAYRQWTDPLLRAENHNAADGSRPKLHISLALLPVDPGQVEYLYQRLLDAEPQEVAVIVDALAPHRDGLKEKLWVVVLTPEKGKEPQRLRAAAALAKYDPDNVEWTKANALVVEDLVQENAVFLSHWTEAYRPVRAHLFAPLSVVFGDPRPERIVERKLATSLLASYAADEPQVLADLMMDADAQQFRALYGKFKAHGERSVKEVQAELDKRPMAVPDKVIFERADKIAEDDARVKTPGGLLTAKRFEIGLQAGKAYWLTMDSQELDSFLVLQDKTGTELASDIGGGLHSLLFYTPPGDDKYVVFAASRLDPMVKSTGAFVLKVAETAGDGAKEKLAKRQANAAVALLKMNRPEKVWQVLKHLPDPRVRSYVVNRLYPLGAEGGALVKRLREEPDITVRRALLLALGDYSAKDLSPDDRKILLDQARGIYRTDPDPGLHAAAELLLRQWQDVEWLKQINADWTKDGKGRASKIDGIKDWLTKDKEKTPPQWYVNGQGQTMVVIPGPVEFVMGSPGSETDRGRNEPQHKKRIGRTFALAAKLVTMEQYRQFEMGHGAKYPLKYIRAGDLPVAGVNWFKAAAYCNWLSKQEGIPEDQWCFEMDAKGEVTKWKERYLSLSGYRLPTEAEMEYATRAGAVTARYYGETDELLENYAWYLKNSKDQPWPVGSLKPNDFGLFDMHGNVNSWCQEYYSRYPSNRRDGTVEDKENGLDIAAESDSRVIRGGAHGNPPSFARSAFRNITAPATRNSEVGFRSARTLPLDP
jgi:formylglycine-generating enzyme required for sulfatase activity